MQVFHARSACERTHRHRPNYCVRFYSMAWCHTTAVRCLRSCGWAPEGRCRPPGRLQAESVLAALVGSSPGAVREGCLQAMRLLERRDADCLTGAMDPVPGSAVLTNRWCPSCHLGRCPHATCRARRGVAVPAEDVLATACPACLRLCLRPCPAEPACHQRLHAGQGLQGGGCPASLRMRMQPAVRLLTQRSLR